jgi:polysaccharide deactylase WbmS-like protein
MRELSGTFLDRLDAEPAYCFTSDLDWAPESMIEDTLQIFSEAEVPLTPFITHASRAIGGVYNGDRAAEAGVHPNFRPGSTHGGTCREVIDHVLQLWPAAQCFRSHGFVDSSDIAAAFFARGLRYDSNICLHLQARLVPLSHSTGLIRFPVFLEDDVVLARAPDPEIKSLLPALGTSGLKIFNFHPQHVALNTPSAGYYARVKPQVGDNWQRHTHRGRGVRSLLLDLLSVVRDAPGLGIFSLAQLYRQTIDCAVD